MWCLGGSAYPEASRRVQVHLEWGHLPVEGARPVATGVNLRNPKDRTGRFIVSGAGFASVGDVPRSPRGSRAGTLPCVDVRLSSSCTSPQVERRDPLGVGLRPGCGDCRVAGKTARDKPSVARPAARRYAQGIRPHFYTVRRGRRKRAPRYSEVTDFAPSPVLARCWLKYGSPSTGLRTSLSRGTDTGRRRYCFGYS
ncbi:hypothetical protein EAG_03558 [Camponotus floridanus]|uniref:Uncharacterized protein n=1 Tax=Camponotus floridanus TaxID=104421 RepID=E2A5B4_CAMFO|nr:hypothetical protein EAG_01177 [Camponotus floridanus]EFN71376.1 hypothetical protein EAG_03558 [Camponotus floridanus]